MGKLDGKLALITGGSRGIGFATAKLFSDEGAHVIITGRDPAQLAVAKKSLGDKHNEICSDAGNISDIHALMQYVKKIGKLDILFLNAAFASPVPFEIVTETQFDAVTNVNFKGPFFTIQKAIELGVFNKNAAIIVTTSITNQAGTPSSTVYAANKAALRSLVRSLALVLIRSDLCIRVNAVNPGPISTDGFNNMDLPPEIFKEVKSTIEGLSPIGRFGTPEEVAKTVLFLASDDSSYVVGHELTVDGGITQVGLP